MKYFKIFALVISLALVCIKLFPRWTGEISHEQSSEVNASWQRVVDYARANLPLEGRLAIKSDGFVYLKVDDEYIRTLFPMLGLVKKGYREPPYFRSKDSPGAHISVFYEDENVSPKEIGQTFHFDLKDIVIVHPSKNTSYAILEVESPELEKLREKYGLKPHIRGHKYHISLGKKNNFHHSSTRK